VTRPEYIVRGGDLVMSPPLEHQNVTMYSFLVNADLDALTAICDQHLNAVSEPSGIVYKPLLPMASIVCADIVKSFSTTPPDSQKGWMAERDFGVWIPVVATKLRPGPEPPGRLAWYMPYLFVDNVAAMVTGREVYGFFKQTATLGMPASPELPGPFTIDTLAIPKFSPESQGTVVRLMTLSSESRAAAPNSIWAHERDALAAVAGEVRRLFFDGVKGLPIPIWDVVKELLEDLITGNVPMVFLKQFRDAHDSTKACYQAVIEAPAHLERWLAGGFTNPHEVSILPCDSHPIARECGLGGPQLRAELGFWCRMNFLMQAGQTIAERGP
jgi:hypothetical protein